MDTRCIVCGRRAAKSERYSRQPVCRSCTNVREPARAPRATSECQHCGTAMLYPGEFCCWDCFTTALTGQTIPVLAIG